MKMWCLGLMLLWSVAGVAPLGRAECGGEFGHWLLGVRAQARAAGVGQSAVDGAADGILGAKTRAAVRQEQLRQGLPADGWPTAGLAAGIPVPAQAVEP